MRTRLSLALATAVASFLPAQDRIAEERVGEVLGFLAQDALGGRDSPSPGLELAADWIAAAFRTAGLEPGVAAPDEDGERSWFHRYELDGLRIPIEGATCRARRGDEAVDLKPGVDFRIWSNGRAFEGRDLKAETDDDNGGGAQSRRRMAARSPRLLVVPGDSPVWVASEGERSVLTRRLPGGAPVVLVRRGVLEGEDDEWTFDFDLPAPEPVRVPLRNVVGILPGTDLKDEYVLVTAHYDHVGLQPRSGDGIFNGADDNATGTTAVTTLAEHFARRQSAPRRSIMFVCFSAEEKGLRGSRAMAEDPPVPLDQIACVVNLEMLGRPEKGKSDYAWVTGAGYSDFAAIAGEAFQAQKIELDDFAMADRLFGASDNYPFAAKGVVAHSISAGSLHRDYHQPTDELDRIDLEHMTAVINGLADVVLAFANREERPVWNEAGQKAIRGRRR